MLHIDIRLIIKLLNLGNHGIHTINSGISCVSDQRQWLPWSFVISAERIIEDHESVMEVLSGWGMDTDSRLYFRKNYAKYEFFRKPLVSVCFVLFTVGLIHSVRTTVTTERCTLLL